MDSLGTEREFGEGAEQVIAMEWTKKLAEGWARISTEKLSKEREEREKFKEANKEHWEAMRDAKAEMEAELPGLLEASAAAWLESQQAAKQAAPGAEEAAPAE